MKSLLMNIFLAMVILAVTFTLVYLSNSKYGKSGSIVTLLYLIGGFYCVIKVIPWNKKD